MNKSFADVARQNCVLIPGFLAALSSGAVTSTAAYAWRVPAARVRGADAHDANSQSA